VNGAKIPKILATVFHWITRRNGITVKRRRAVLVWCEREAGRYVTACETQFTKMNDSSVLEGVLEPSYWVLLSGRRQVLIM